MHERAVSYLGVEDHCAGVGLVHAGLDLGHVGLHLLLHRYHLLQHLRMRVTYAQ